MKLVHPEWKMQIDCKENQAVLWIMESPRIFRTYLEAFLCQMQTREGRFVLSEDDKELELYKAAELILNPFEIDVNDKKILNKIYSELKEFAFGESYYLKTREMFGLLTSYFMELEKEMCIPLTCAEPDLVQVLKALDVKTEESECDMVEMIGQYLHLAAKLMNKKVIVFVNLSAYLESWVIEKLLKEAFYLKLYVILMERQEIDLAISKKCYIIDRDYCEIY